MAMIVVIIGKERARCCQEVWFAKTSRSGRFAESSVTLESNKMLLPRMCDEQTNKQLTATFKPGQILVLQVQSYTTTSDALLKRH